MNVLITWIKCRCLARLVTNKKHRLEINVLFQCLNSVSDWSIQKTQWWLRKEDMHSEVFFYEQ